MTASPSPQELTQLLADSGYWDRATLDQLAPVVYDELRRLAHQQMSRERPDHTLQTTALVNEAYLRLAEQPNPGWRDRAHFFSVAARMMRHILVNYAKSRQAEKRGGGAKKLKLIAARIFQAEQGRRFAICLDR